MRLHMMRTMKQRLAQLVRRPLAAGMPATLLLLASLSWSQVPEAQGKDAATTVPIWLRREMRQLSEQQLAREIGAIRSAYRESIALQGPPEPVAEVRDVLVPADGERTIRARFYVPVGPQRSKRPLVVYFHGGGFFSGDLDTHDVMLRRLANISEASVLAVDYRLAPENPFPAGLEDCYAAVLWAARHAELLGIDAERVATAGDSAGGNLSTAVVQLLRDRGGPRLTMQLLFYPVTAGLAETHSRAELRSVALISTHYMALTSRAYLARPADAWSTLFATLRSDPRGAPPTLVMSAGFDTLRDEGEQYVEMLRTAGVKAQWIRYGDSPHGFTQFFGQKDTSMAGRISLDAGALALKVAFSGHLGL